MLKSQDWDKIHLFPMNIEHLARFARCFRNAAQGAMPHDCPTLYLFLLYKPDMTFNALFKRIIYYS